MSGPKPPQGIRFGTIDAITKENPVLDRIRDPKQLPCWVEYGTDYCAAEHRRREWERFGFIDPRAAEAESPQSRVAMEVLAPVPSRKVLVQFRQWQDVNDITRAPVHVANGSVADADVDHTRVALEVARGALMAYKSAPNASEMTIAGNDLSSAADSWLRGAERIMVRVFDHNGDRVPDEVHVAIRTGNELLVLTAPGEIGGQPHPKAASGQ